MPRRFQRDHTQVLESQQHQQRGSMLFNAYFTTTQLISMAPRLWQLIIEALPRDDVS